MKNNKQQFPAFKAQKKWTYLDNASTTQIPEVVLAAMDGYNKKYKANIHRGLYAAAIKATEMYEGARDSIAKFINAQREEIIFTSGTTAALNQLAYSLSPRLSHRDNVVLTRMEHHANLVPWQQMAKHYGFELRFIELKGHCHSESPQGGTKNLSQRSLRSFAPLRMTDEYELDLESAKHLIDANTKIVSFSLVSNVLGTIAPAKELIKLARSKRAITIIDAAQATAHLPIDVKKLDCDFLTFSGHKMYGPTGIGVLYGKKIMLEENLEPFLFGGEMVKEVTYESATWNDVPHKFEAGTPNIAGAIGLGAATEFLIKIGWKKIMKHEQELTKYALKKLSNEVGIIGALHCHSESRLSRDGTKNLSQQSLRSFGHPFVGTQDDKKNRIGVISFTIPNIHPHDIAEILSQKNICIRAGHHCAMPLHTHLGLTATARVSLGIYNTKKDIDTLVNGIKKIKRMFTVN